MRDCSVDLSFVERAEEENGNQNPGDGIFDSWGKISHSNAVYACRQEVSGFIFVYSCPFKKTMLKIIFYEMKIKSTSTIWQV